VPCVGAAGGRHRKLEAVAGNTHASAEDTSDPVRRIVVIAER
jgi:hypothetical protein